MSASLAAPGRLNYVVLGASGMAGHVIATHLRDSGHEVLGIAGRNKLNESTVLVDAFDRAALVDLLRRAHADVVVNCIGALVAESSEFPDRAAYVNAYLPHLLESEFRMSSTRVFHLSTDCVFSGASGSYDEAARRDGESFYDRSKALGELENDKDLTLRTSIIGPEIRPVATGLFDWFLNAKGNVQGYRASLWDGITTLELAKQIEQLSRTPSVTGIVHPVPAQVVSKFELLQMIADTFGLRGRQIESVAGKKADKSLVSTRPDYVPPQSNHLEMLRELYEWIMGHAHLYRGLPWFDRLSG